MYHGVIIAIDVSGWNCGERRWRAARPPADATSAGSMIGWQAVILYDLCMEHKPSSSICLSCAWCRIIIQPAFALPRLVCYHWQSVTIPSTSRSSRSPASSVFLSDTFSQTLDRTWPRLSSKYSCYGGGILLRRQRSTQQSSTLRRNAGLLGLYSIKMAFR